jgi:predicted RNA-binding Zn ribbon-like protein
MTGRSNESAVSPWKDGFLFIGNQLALDLLNTRPAPDGEPVEFLPDFDALLGWMRAAGQLRPSEVVTLRRRWGKSSRARRTLEAIRELREKLRKEVLAWEGGAAPHRSTVSELNRLQAKHPMRARLTVAGGVSSMEHFFETRGPEDLLAPLAHSAAMLFASVDRSRVRKCGQCVLHFYDTSKKGMRHWCSMRLCGNRAKVAAYSRRKRVEAE